MTKSKTSLPVGDPFWYAFKHWKPELTVVVKETKRRRTTIKTEVVIEALCQKLSCGHIHMIDASQKLRADGTIKCMECTHPDLDWYREQEGSQSS